MYVLTGEYFLKPANKYDAKENKLDNDLDIGMCSDREYPILKAELERERFDELISELDKLSRGEVTVGDRLEELMELAPTRYKFPKKPRKNNALKIAKRDAKRNLYYKALEILGTGLNVNPAKRAEASDMAKLFQNGLREWEASDWWPAEWSEKVD